MILFAVIALIDLSVIVYSTITVPAGRLAVDLMIFVLIAAPLLAAGALNARRVGPDGTTRRPAASPPERERVSA